MPALLLLVWCSASVQTVCTLELHQPINSFRDLLFGYNIEGKPKIEIKSVLHKQRKTLITKRLAFAMYLCYRYYKNTFIIIISLENCKRTVRHAIRSYRN